MNKITQSFIRTLDKFKNHSTSKNIFIFTALLGFSSWLLFHLLDLTLVYNDSRSYLNIARSVIDNKQPGFDQIGTIWLPINHILKFPTIWFDWAYRSGFSGSLISILSYAGSSVFIYKLGMLLTERRFAALTGLAVFALNPNILFMQATPMSEMLFMLFLTGMLYNFALYLKLKDYKSILGMAIFSALAILTRYEGWFVAFVLIGLAGIEELWSNRDKENVLSSSFGKIIAMSVPSILAISLWLAWNSLMTGDALNFAIGDLSALSFTENVTFGKSAQGSLISTYLVSSFSSAAVAGIMLLIIGIISFFVYIYFSDEQVLSTRKRVFLLAAMLSPIFFVAMSIFLGTAAMKYPGLNDDLFGLNIRYAIFIMPVVAIGVATLAKLGKVVSLAIIALMMLQYVFLAVDKPILIRDAQESSSTVTFEESADSIDDLIQDGDDILISFSNLNPLVHELPFDIDNYVHEGVNALWGPSQANPAQESVEWVIISSNDDDALQKMLRDKSVKLKSVFVDANLTLFEVQK